MPADQSGAPIPPWATEHIRRERRDSLRAGGAFARACAAGDVALFFAAIDAMNESVDGWRLGMSRAGRIREVPDEIRQAFLAVWIEYKTLPLRVEDRRAMADALRVLAPRNYSGPPLRLYRGTRRAERRRRLYGFSWTTRKDVAQSFADAHDERVRLAATLGVGIERPSDHEGIVLETTATQDMIFTMREAEVGYYDEGEVIVDPFRLDRVIIARA